MRHLPVTIRWVLAVASSAAAALSLNAAVGFTLSTNSVPNDFNGTVTLTIMGLTSGQAIRVEKFADLNANGTIDASDPLVRFFGVADGGTPAIGGVRNLNVPGDDDGTANGQITVNLSQPGLDNVFSSIVGNYIFRVSDSNQASPSFTPITQALAVTAHSYAQGVQGTVTNSAGGAAIPGAAVILLNSNGNAVGGTVADASGNYQVLTNAGSYQVLAVASGFVADLSTASATVTAGAIATHNVALTAGTTTISGQITRQGTSNGVGAIFVLAESSDSHLAGTFTDLNGNYSIPATAGTWTVDTLVGQLAAKGLLHNQTKATANTTGGSAVVNFTETNANALIYGKVTDGTNPLVGFQVGADDQSGLYETNGISISPDGSYSLGVAGGSSWNVGLAADTLPAGHLAGPETVVTIFGSQAIVSNIVSPTITAHLRGTLTKGGVAQTGMEVDAVLQNNGNGQFTVSSITDGSGNFDLGVDAGSWVVTLNNTYADANNLVTPALKYQVADNQDINAIALNVVDGTGTISGRINDLNAAPVTNALVVATATISTVQYTASYNTDSSGHYSLPVINGTWTMNVYTGVGLYYNPRNLTLSGSAVANFIPTVITQQPQPQTVGTGASASFSIVNIAPGTPTFQWQVSTDSGATWNPVPATAPFSGTTTSVLQISAVTNAMNNDRFRCVISYTGTPGVENSFAGKLTVTAAAPTFTNQPTAGTVNTGQTATFTGQVNDSVATFQWQVSANGGSTWTNVTDNATYAGSTTGTLTITSPGAALNGRQYRLVATDTLVTNSNAVTLTVRSIVADFNGDGIADVMWENSPTGIDRTVWYLNGAGGISGFAYLAGSPPEWHMVGTGDFNGDGQTDIVWEDRVTGDRTFWLMNGATIGSFAYLAFVDPTWHIAAIGDFDGDGQSDILWENAPSGIDRAVWFLNGTGIKTFGYLAGIPTEWRIVGAADFDGDGQTDILWENTITGDRSVWLMNGTSILGFAFVANVDPAWHIAAVADFNGDGKPDLLWENKTTGDRAFWYLNGTSLTSMGYLAFVDPSWHIAP